MKRAYFVREKDAETGIAVIASNSKEAKRIGMRHDCCMDCDFIDIRVKWMKSVDASYLSIGMIDDTIQGLKLGIYSYVDEEECPKCGMDGFLTNVGNGEIMCSICEEKLNKKDINEEEKLKSSD